MFDRLVKLTLTDGTLQSRNCLALTNKKQNYLNGSRKEHLNDGICNDKNPTKKSGAHF
jgi:hypothetical protein